MSAKIGQIETGNGATKVCEVWCSRGGVEMGSVTLSPTEARNAAALLVRAADECEWMRSREEKR
jgi:hypothetical protein